jgi:hypothetical protein
MKQNFTVRQGALDGVEALLSVTHYPLGDRASSTMRTALDLEAER